MPRQFSKYNYKRGGLLGGPLVPAPGKLAFYFRVRARCPDGSFRSFDCAEIDFATVQEAYHALASFYIGAKITALNETEFDLDGLPKLRVTRHVKKHAPDRRLGDASTSLAGARA